LYNNCGFSLVEQGVIISLLAIIVISLNQYNFYSKSIYNIKETKRRISIIKQSLEFFYLNHGDEENLEFICPENERGKISCNNERILYKGQILSKGYVPYKKLNIAKYYSYDAWGNKFIYSIDIDALRQKKLDSAFVILFVNDSSNQKNIKIKEIITTSLFLSSIYKDELISKNFCKLWQLQDLNKPSCSILNNKIKKLCL